MTYLFDWISMQPHWIAGHEPPREVIEAALLEAGHGKSDLPGSHPPGSRTDLCPKCKLELEQTLERR
jgi:hypothetical protein